MSYRAYDYVTDDGGRYDLPTTRIGHHEYDGRYSVHDTHGRYALAGGPRGRQVMTGDGLGFSLKPPKWLRKSAGAILPIAAIGASLLIPGVGPLAATAIGAGLKKASSLIPLSKTVITGAGTVSQSIQAATSMFPGGSVSQPTPIMAPASIPSSAGSSALQPAGATPATPSWLLPVLIGGGLLLFMGGRRVSRR